ncbi:MAG: HupE/UreJ family protein, partial [Janthinobacterium sp.]
MSLLLWLWLAPAQAHKPSDSYLSLAVHGQQIDGQWDIALRDLDFAIGLDGNGDGALTWDEIRARHAAIAAYALQRLHVASDQGACPLKAVEQLLDHHTDGAYSVLRFQASCPGAAPASLAIGYTLFADLDPQHKGLVKIDSGGTTQTAIFDPDSPRQTISLAAPDRLAQFGAYVKHGVWHIWIGYDHILFLLSLLLPAVLLPGISEQQKRLNPTAENRGRTLRVRPQPLHFGLGHKHRRRARRHRRRRHARNHVRWRRRADQLIHLLELRHQLARRQGDHRVALRIRVQMLDPRVVAQAGQLLRQAQQGRTEVSARFQAS